MSDSGSEKVSKQRRLGGPLFPMLASSLSGNPSNPRRWWLWFLLLLIAPYIPELAIRFVVAIASAKGCAPADTTTCAIGPFDAGVLISAALTLAVWRALGFAFGGVLVWLFATLIVMSNMWRGLFLRLAGAFILASVTALLPYLAPMMAFDDLRHALCQPNEGGVGTCVLYGSNLGDAPHLAVTAGWLVLVGLPAAGLVFLIYAVTAIVLAIRARRTPAPS